MFCHEEINTSFLAVNPFSPVLCPGFVCESPYCLSLLVVEEKIENAKWEILKKLVNIHFVVNSKFSFSVDSKRGHPVQ